MKIEVQPRGRRRTRDAALRSDPGGRSTHTHRIFPREHRMSDTSLAFWTVSPGRGELRPAALRPPTVGEVRVRSLYSGVSRGTESLVFRGEVPESEYQRMRAPFQEGDFPGPVKYGYISVGVVEDGVDRAEVGGGELEEVAAQNVDAAALPAGEAALFAARRL